MINKSETFGSNVYLGILLSKYLFGGMAADLAETRKFCVQSLRKAGKFCGVPLIRDSASRDRFEDFSKG